MQRDNASEIVCIQYEYLQQSEKGRNLQRQGLYVEVGKEGAKSQNQKQEKTPQQEEEITAWGGTEKEPNR